MHQPQPHKLPKSSAYAKLNVEDIIAITGRLQHILLEENALLAAMKIKDLAPMHEEKLKLTRQLEAFKKQLVTDNSAVKAASDQNRETLLALSEDLNHAAEENLRRTTIAQKVNKQAMETIVGVIAERQRLHVYGSQGQANPSAPQTLSVNLNERA